MEGTNSCVQCSSEFTEDNPCCCDFGLFEDGSHTDGRCKTCCGPHSNIWDGKTVAGGTFERCE